MLRTFYTECWNLAGPSAAIIALLVLGTILSFTRWTEFGRALSTIGVLCLVAVTFVPLDSWALRPLESRFTRPVPMPAHVDGIIVLGGAFDDSVSDANGLPSLNDSAERLTGFVTLARKYPQAKLVATGGSRVADGQPSEADAVERLLDNLGIDLSRVIFERKSRNTYENAVLSKELAQPKPGETWLLVTSAAHIPRSVGVFRKIGWPVIAMPVSYKASNRYTVNLAEHLKRLDDAMHEWIGLVQYRVLGRTDELFPEP